MEFKNQVQQEINWAELNAEECETASLNDMNGWKEFD